jgi:dephospho-CoA kinase
MTKEIEDSQAICIGITGGFGSGKTSVAKIIREQGFPVIFTDELAKELMEKNDNLRTKLIKSFGDDTYNQDGTLNSRHISSVVFTGSDEGRVKLDLLNSIVHPPVIDEMIRMVDELEQQGNALIFVESALIYEAELEEGFDYIINITASTEKIFERAALRGFPEEMVQLRIIEQMAPDKKANWADFNIDNDLGLDELKNATLMLLEIIKAMT